MEKLRWRLGLRGFEGVASDGKSGGLALFWHESLDVEVWGKSNWYIDVCVRGRLNDHPWRATFVMGNPGWRIDIVSGVCYVIYVRKAKNQGWLWGIIMKQSCSMSIC